MIIEKEIIQSKMVDCNHCFSSKIICRPLYFAQLMMM